MDDPGDDGQQPQGSYPRLNSKLLSTGQYTNSIVSMVGHFQPGANPDGTVPFQTSDGGIVSVSTDVVEMPLIGPDSPPYEIIGQAMSPDNVTVRGCCGFTGRSPLMLLASAGIVGSSSQQGWVCCP
jgi:hypothetical protein